MANHTEESWTAEVQWVIHEKTAVFLALVRVSRTTVFGRINYLPYCVDIMSNEVIIKASQASCRNPVVLMWCVRNTPMAETSLKPEYDAARLGNLSE